jgi:hypothetical protein
MHQFTDSEALSGIVHEALGAEARVVGVNRLRGGSKKGVYRVHTSGSRAASVIVYSWAEAENFWPAAEAIDLPSGPAETGRPWSPGSRGAPRR